MNSRLAWLVLMLALGACGPAAKAPPGAEPAAAPEEGGEETLRISEVTLGAGDEFQIAVWRNPDLDGRYTVDSTGVVVLPLIGALPVEGRSIHEIRSAVVDSLRRYLKDPQVTLTVTAVRSRKFYVLGEVRNPGIFALGNQPTALLDALGVAGGMTEDAKAGKIFHVSAGGEEPQVEVYNVDRLLKGGQATANPPLGPGDIVYVPPKKIAQVGRFFQHLYYVTRTIVDFERAIILGPLVENAIKDERSPSVIVVDPQ